MLSIYEIGMFSLIAVIGFIGIWAGCRMISFGSRDNFRRRYRAAFVHRRRRDWSMKN